MSLRDETQVSPADVDALLLPFLEAETKEDEERLLGRLLEEHVDPVIRQILRSKMQWHFDPGEGGYSDPDVDEAYREIQLHLLGRLLDLKKKHPADKSLATLKSYVAAAARNACDEYLRRKFPQRRKLKDRIRYCLTSRAGLALWKEGGKGWLSGLAEWEVDGPAADGQPLSVLIETLSVRLPNVAAERLELDELLTAVFRAVGRPLELNQLTAAVAKLLGVEEAQLNHLDAGANPLSERVASPQAGVNTLFEQRQLLEVLWGEIQLLPRAQRVALLCNLRSPQGVNVITLFPATQVATLEQVAEALEMPLAEFEVLWGRLPLDDLSIAEYLKITRQQVINLRQSARDRLMRRRRTLEGETTS